jgi:hypothetical protein
VLKGNVELLPMTQPNVAMHMVLPPCMVKNEFQYDFATFAQLKLCVADLDVMFNWAC